MARILFIFAQFTVVFSLNIHHDFKTIAETNSYEFQDVILNTCFSNVTQSIVVIANWSMVGSKFIHRSSLPKGTHLLGIGKEDNLSMYQAKTKRYLIESNGVLPLPASSFIIEATELVDFEISLYKLKYSEFWNIHGIFLINNIHALDTCIFAHSFLKMIWTFNVLNGIYMCRLANGNVALYMFNPFNMLFSKSWEKVAIFTQENRHPLALFRLVYEPKDFDLLNLCDTLRFDMTQDLSGYPIKIFDMTYYLQMPIENEGSVRRFIQRDPYETARKVQKVVWEKMRANTSYSFFELTEIGTIHNNGTADRAVAEILGGRFDCCGVDDYQRGLWKNEANYFRPTGLCFMIKKKSKTIFERLSEIFPPHNRLALLVYFVSVTFLLICLLKINYAEAILDVLRGAVGVAMINKPFSRFTKLFYMCIVYNFLIMNTLMQSHLSSLITTAPTTWPDIKSVSDIVANNYNVCGSAYYQQYYNDTPLQGLITPIEDLVGCTELLNDDAQTVCVEDCITTRYVLNENNEFHIAKDPLFERYSVFLFRDDSPFLRRFELICRRLAQHGLFHFFKSLEKLNYKRAYVSGSSPIRINQLAYAFYFMIAAFAIAIVIFLFELVANFFQRRRRKVRIFKPKNR